MSSEKDYHPALSSLSWLFGTWESIEAEVFYPTMDTIKFDQILEFLPTLQPVLEYKADTFHPEKKTKLHCEGGYIRIDAESGKIALLTSHNFGLIEISEGTVEENVLNLESKSLSQISFTKLTATVKVIRKFHLEEDELVTTVFMETANTPMQKHMDGRFRKTK